MGKNGNIQSHVGETWGIYTITDITEKKNKAGQQLYKCTCNKCGFVRYATYSEVHAPSAIVTHCQHVRADGSYVVYGYQWNNQRIRKIFCDMMVRCYDDDAKDYRWYGEKGIGICKEWRDNPKSFEEWALNNGYNDNLTIDRIVVENDYSPDNCQWIPMEENSRKAGKVNWVTVGDETLTGKQWSAKLGLGPNTINTAIREHGEDKTKELIQAMLVSPPSTKYRKSHQTWFDVYDIQV